MTAGPPLWLVGGAVSLFGVTPGARGDGWLTPAVRSAFGSSDELWVETPPELEVDGNPLLQSLGVRGAGDPGLSPAVAERVEAALAVLGMPPGSLRILRPWVAVQILDRARLDRAKVDPANDVEHVLVRLARDAGLPVRTELVDADAAIRMLGEGPDDAQEEYLSWTLDLVWGADERLERDFAVWRAGDLDSLEAAAADTAVRYPAFWSWLVAPRNEAWVPRIRAALDAGTRSFVAPGMGHLVGPGSIPALLCEAGVGVERVT